MGGRFDPVWSGWGDIRYLVMPRSSVFISLSQRRALPKNIVCTRNGRPEMPEHENSYASFIFNNWYVFLVIFTIVSKYEISSGKFRLKRDHCLPENRRQLVDSSIRVGLHPISSECKVFWQTIRALKISANIRHALWLNIDFLWGKYLYNEQIWSHEAVNELQERGPNSIEGTPTVLQYSN